MRKFFIAILLLLAAFALQFFLASIGFPYDLAFAALIAFAFIFSWTELAVLDLVFILILNWQPMWNAVLVTCGLFPLAVGMLRNIFPWQPRLGVPIAAALGAILVSIIGMPMPLANIGVIVVNAAVTAGFAAGTWSLVAGHRA